MNQQKKNYALPIAMMFALFAMISFVTGLQNPMGVIVKNQFGTSAFLSQLGNAANFIAYLFMGIPAGLLLQKIGYKKTALAAVTVGFIGVGITYLSGIAESFGVYLAGAFISGFSMCMLNTVVNPMLNTLGGEGKKGNQLLQFGGSINSLAATLVPILVGYLMGNVARATIDKANPALFIAMGIFALAFLVLYFVNIPEPHMHVETKEKVKDPHSPFSFRHFVLGTVAIFLYVGVEVGIPNIANLFMTTETEGQIMQIKDEYTKQQENPAYLAELTAHDAAAQQKIDALEVRFNNGEISNKEYDEQVNTLEESKLVISKGRFDKISEITKPGLGISTTIAGSIVGAYWFLMLIGRLFGGALGAKFSSKTMLIFVALLGLVLIILAIFCPLSAKLQVPSFMTDVPTEIPINFVFLVLCGLCTSVMWGGIFNLAVEGLGKYTAAASGIFMVMVCGGGILPLIQGFAVDTVGYIASYWVIFAALIYIMYYALIGCKNVNKNIPVD